jgi:hypothetical protein
MKNVGLKIFVFILFLIQAGIAFLFLYLFKNFFTNLSGSKEILTNPILIYSLLGLLMLISAVYVGIIFFRRANKTVYVPSMALNQPVKETKVSKQKHEQEQKRLQAMNEKKKQILTDLVKNLSVQLSKENYANQLLVNISKFLDIFQGIVFIKDPNDGIFRKAGTYAYYSQDDFPEFADGVGLTGQVAVNKKLLNIVNIPDKYITVVSGLGKSSPSNLIIFPILYNDKSIGIVEIASFIKFDSFSEQMLTEFSLLIGQHLFEINKLPETKSV